jgi:hypothetical protein
MNSVVRTVFGAALLLTGASAAMAQSANPPAAAPAGQAAAANTAPNAGQTGTATVAAAAPAAQAQKPRGMIDNTDTYGGHDPNSTAGMREFFAPAY